MNPLVAILLGTLLLDERLALPTLAGAALIVVSVFVTVRSEAPRAPRRRGRHRAGGAGSRRGSCARACTVAVATRATLALDLRALAREVLEQVGAGEDRRWPAAAMPTTTAALGPDRSANTSSSEARHVDGRERRPHRDGDVLVERVRVLEDAVEQAALLDRTDDVGERLRPARAHHRQLRDPVALHEVDRSADLLVRVDRDEVGQVRVLGRA